MTQPQLQRRVTRWRDRMRLGDWVVTVKVEPESEMPDCVGQIPNDPEEKTATLRLREDVADDPDRTIVHELYHLRLLPWSDGDEDEPNHEAREVAINVMADSFVRAYPRRRKAE